MWAARQLRHTRGWAGCNRGPDVDVGVNASPPTRLCLCLSLRQPSPHLHPRPRPLSHPHPRSHPRPHTQPQPPTTTTTTTAEPPQLHARAGTSPAARWVQARWGPALAPSRWGWKAPSSTPCSTWTTKRWAGGARACMMSRSASHTPQIRTTQAALGSASPEYCNP